MVYQPKYLYYDIIYYIIILLSDLVFYMSSVCSNAMYFVLIVVFPYHIKREKKKIAKLFSPSSQ